MNIRILTTAHWPGDPRLNRHRTYLEEDGHTVVIESFHDRPRWRAVLAAIVASIQKRSDVVIFPDPEMYVLGSLAVRLRRGRALIDIHEDYPLTASGRAWVPTWARWAVASLARLGLSLGRRTATAVVVAAPELAHDGDVVVMNLPRSSDTAAHSATNKDQVVYIGDITFERGLSEMCALEKLVSGQTKVVLVGRLSVSSADEPQQSDRLELTGRLPHSEAWELASGSIAGLCLLQPLPAYQHAVATKIWEYMEAGIPPVVSDLPGQRSVVSQIDADLVCVDLEAVVSVIERLKHDDDYRLLVSTRAQELYRETWELSRPDLAIQSLVAP